MSKKRIMPYRNGSNYDKLFRFWQKKPGQMVTVNEMIAEGERIGMKTSAARASTNVILSKSKEGYGNMSAGKGYYAESVWKEGNPMRKKLVWRKDGEAEPERPARKIKTADHVTSEKTSNPPPVPVAKKGDKAIA